MATYDLSAGEPDGGVISLRDYTDGDDQGNSPYWGRTVSGQWKGYKDGGKVYLSWAELLRRWGPMMSEERTHE